jgi:hypothetical protein
MQIRDLVGMVDNISHQITSVIGIIEVMSFIAWPTKNIKIAAHIRPS